MEALLMRDMVVLVAFLIYCVHLIWSGAQAAVVMAGETGADV